MLNEFYNKENEGNILENCLPPVTLIHEKEKQNTLFVLKLCTLHISESW